MNKIRVNQGRIVPFNFRIAATFFLFLLMFLAMMHLQELWAIVASIGFSMLIPLLWSSYRIIEIDPTNNAIWHITWILGYQIRDLSPYAQPEKLYINLLDESQRVNSHGGQTHTIRTKAHVAYLKLANGAKHRLISAKNEQALLKKLQPIEEKLGLKAIKNY
ncbi:hypothetical protein [Marinoscillum furvescens]|uniref:PH (Pleckstrin Homology) domain-containing protein n=1 Tax=Marinoscillum furvescens DSM 4134 TaxID=1122208 RepID=A0A3D9L3X2_MARFU|nr:hypothetical protein [Marinoscillum furvescens]RED99890.1 hypothetical protein C7460_107174 [Marinoscillum furvescens DSM 4134]